MTEEALDADAVSIVGAGVEIAIYVSASVGGTESSEISSSPWMWVLKMSQVEAGVSGGGKYGEPAVLLESTGPAPGVSKPALHSE